MLVALKVVCSSLGSDFDETMTPFEAGFEGLVDFAKGDFIGPKRSRSGPIDGVVHGVSPAPRELLATGRTLTGASSQVGRVTSSAWSPHIAVRHRPSSALDDPELGTGAKLDVECTDGVVRTATVCELPNV